jgi:hypothetical protein
LDRVNRIDAVFEPHHVQVALAEIYLRPVKINGLGDTQTMASHKEHQGGVSPTITSLTSGLDELLKLVSSEITPSIAEWFSHVDALGQTFLLSAFRHLAD